MPPSTGRTSTSSYALRRLLQAVPVVFAILVLNFLLLHLAPGDAAQVLAGEAGSATPEYMAQFVRSEIKKWEEPIKASGAQIE